MRRFRRILCPVDFDANSLLALRLAAELARERQTMLHLLHVTAVVPNPEIFVPVGKLEAEARTKLERLAAREVAGTARYRIHVTTGEPGVAALQMAKRLRADLIVMATHGRKGLRRLVLGSVTERVVRQAPCPVLTVKPRAARPRVRPRAATTAAARSRRTRRGRRRSGR